MEEDPQIAELTKEALKLVREIQTELSFSFDRDRCPTTGSMTLVKTKVVKLSKISDKIAWLTAPAFMKEP